MQLRDILETIESEILQTYGPDSKEKTAVALIILGGLALAFGLANDAGFDVAGGRRNRRLFLRENTLFRLRLNLRHRNGNRGQTGVNYALRVAPVGTLATPDGTRTK